MPIAAAVSASRKASLLALLVIPRLHKELRRGTRSRHHRLTEPFGRHTLFDQVLLYGQRALLGIGVALAGLFVRLDAELGDLVVPAQDLRQLIEQPRRVRKVLLGENDRLVDRDLHALNLDVLGAGVGTSVVVLDAVDGLGLGRALVELIGDAVFVVVGIGAAVLVLEAVLIFRLVRALVVLIGDAVPVVVGIGAAVHVLEAVFVLRLVRAFVLDVGNAISVGVDDV